MPQKASIIKCLKCGHISNIISDICIKCGSKLEKICGDCGFSNAVEKNHCDQCGGLLALKPNPPEEPGNGPPPPGAPPDKPKYQFEMRPIWDTVSEKDISFRVRRPADAPVSAAPAEPPPAAAPSFQPTPFKLSAPGKSARSAPRNLKKVYGALVAAGFLAVLFFSLYLIVTPHLPKLTLKMAAGAYLKRLSAGRFEEAYAMLSANSKSAVSLKEYAEYSAQYYGKAPPWEFKDVDVHVMEPEAALVKYQLREGTGAWRTDYVSFVREHGKWTRPYIGMLLEPIDAAIAEQDYTQALFLAQKLYLTDPLDPRTSGYLCVAEFFMRLYGKSAESCRKTLLAAGVYPVNTSAEELFWYQFYYSDSLRFTGKLELALDGYNGLLGSNTLTEKEQCPLYVSRADTFVRMKKYDAALSDMLKAGGVCSGDAHKADVVNRLRFMNGEAGADAVSFAQRTAPGQDLPPFGELRRRELEAAAARLGTNNRKYMPKDSWTAAHVSGPEYRVVLRQEAVNMRTRQKEVRDIYIFMVNLWTGVIRLEQGVLPPRQKAKQAAE